MASYITGHVTETLIGSRNDADFETMLDDFLKRMQNVDKKLSVQTQKIVLKGSTEDAVKSLRNRTRTAFKRHTGYAARSVKQVTKESRVTKGVAYTTFGWRDKNLPDIHTKKMRKDGTGFVIKPKPATYIGIWQDLGTIHLKPRHILRDEWESHKKQIIRNIEQSIFEIIDKGLVK